MRMVKTPNWPADRFKALIDGILGETGLNKAQLASLVGMNPSQISRWTNGAGRPRFDSLLGLGRALQERYPDLRVGPSQLAAAAGYSTDDEQEGPDSFGNTVGLSAAAEAKAPAAESEGEDEIDWETFVPKTATEKALLALYQAKQESDRRLQESDRQLKELNDKVDRLARGAEEERRLA